MLGTKNAGRIIKPQSQNVYKRHGRRVSQIYIRSIWAARVIISTAYEDISIYSTMERKKARQAQGRKALHQWRNATGTPRRRLAPFGYPKRKICIPRTSTDTPPLTHPPRWLDCVRAPQNTNLTRDTSEDGTQTQTQKHTATLLKKNSEGRRLNLLIVTQGRVPHRT